jgi:sulfur relay protein TusB/DsrH
MNILYTLRNSPLLHTAYKSLLPVVEKGDSVLFLQDSVCAFQAAPDDLRNFLDRANEGGIRICAVKADLDARGMSPDCETLDYGDVVDLIFAHDKVVNLD